RTFRRQQLSRTIGGAVVDADQLQPVGGIVAASERSKTITQVLPPVPVDDDHADARQDAGCSSGRRWWGWRRRQGGWGRCRGLCGPIRLRTWRRRVMRRDGWARVWRRQVTRRGWARVRRPRVTRRGWARVWRGRVMWRGWALQRFEFVERAVDREQWE